jgi:hypothetical protein
VEVALLVVVIDFRSGEGCLVLRDDILARWRRFGTNICVCAMVRLHSVLFKGFENETRSGVGSETDVITHSLTFYHIDCPTGSCVKLDFIIAAFDAI